ncbi:MAG: 50S ribosomal protein L9 [Candidatus Competibacterales bacterium]
MDIILLQKVENLGNLGDQVKVRPGYARNFLIPQGMATEATEANRQRFEERRAELEGRAAEALLSAMERKEQLSELVVTLTVKAGGEGRLYGSVTPADIADAVSAAGVELKKNEVRMNQGSIRQIGEYDVDVHLHNDVSTTIHVSVVPE